MSKIEGDLTNNHEKPPEYTQEQWKRLCLLAQFKEDRYSDNYFNEQYKKINGEQELKTSYPLIFGPPI
jgi:hypothetical protein